MNVEQLKNHCAGFTNSEVVDAEYPANLLSYNIGQKKFAYFKTSPPERWRFSIRVTAERFLELTDQQGIQPAKYLHRFHWVTIINVNRVDEGYLKELVECSYQQALASLSKKRQRQLQYSEAVISGIQ
ncbi:MAG: hypothetical protein OFPII_09560 [Osedax symbiont Rs1]|nr:MAG: hypothetical protein OFPII_09560 [Osedax symbiont Rs1]